MVRHSPPDMARLLRCLVPVVLVKYSFRSVSEVPSGYEQHSLDVDVGRIGKTMHPAAKSYGAISSAGADHPNHREAAS